MKITEMILEYTQKNKITYRQIAAQAGCSPQNVWNILNRKTNSSKGTREPSLKAVRDICSAIGIELEIYTSSAQTLPETIIQASELQNVSIAALQSILEVAGYSLRIKDPEKTL